ncbi:MAG TPA: competence/damage-inducible protein A [Candidatus Kapabacteria bacterium]|nr:competence/damage-inducible protein A [Candidatus Kapabacteria bacterium]HYM34604.1 competence/damage-inducible protein A [Steroidobacteraceae bacterium]
MLTCEILSIGDELLIGQVVNTNASYISEKLNSIGIDVTRVTTVGDDATVITKAIKRAWKEQNIVIATGGLGPTHDDISKNIVAKFFGKKLILHKQTLARVKARFASFGYKKMPEANIGQAMIPQGFTVLPNDRGTAPGLLYHFNRKTFIILPGVPHEMKFLMENSVIKLLRKIHKKKLGDVIAHRTLLTTGIGESMLAEKVGDVNNFLVGGATLAYLPKTSGVRMRISVRAKSEQIAKNIIEKIERHIRSRIGAHIYGMNDETLEGAVVALLRKRKERIAAAESCTGGMLSMRITNVPGASEIFPGGVVSYSNDIKMQELGVSEATLHTYGAVSEECAIAMAESALKKFGTTYAIAITGIAGPDGGTSERPVGTVWIALADSYGTTTKLFHFGGERAIIRERSSDAALDMLRKKLI